MNQTTLRFYGVLGSSLGLLALLITLRPEIIGTSSLDISSMLWILLVLSLVALFSLAGLVWFRDSIDQDEVLIKFETPPEVAEGEKSDKIHEFEFDSYNEAQEKLSIVIKEILKDNPVESTEDINRAIEKGFWTEDPVSAAFVSEELQFPLVDRLRAWLEEDNTFNRRLVRTVKSIEKLYGRENKSYEFD